MRALSAVLALAAASAANAASWKVQVPNIGSAGVAMSFINNNVGFLPINDNGVGATVLKTVDAGKHWSHPTNNSVFEDAGLFLGSAAYGDNVVALGLFDLFSTQNGGGSWELVTEGSDALVAQGAFSVPSQNKLVVVGQTPTGAGTKIDSGFLESTNGGKSWAFTNLSSVSFTAPRYGAGVGNTWVIAGGTFPDGVDAPAGARVLTQNVIATGERNAAVKFVSPHAAAAAASDDDVDWTAEILVSQDAGETWTAALQSTGQFYFNEVSCGSAENCCAVGEANAGERPGVRIWCTQDSGVHWNESMFVNNFTYSLTGAAFTSPTEAWACGGIFGEIGPQEALYFHSTDAGATWTREAFPDMGGLDCWSMDFPESGALGHGIALTALQSTAELLYS